MDELTVAPKLDIARLVEIARTIERREAAAEAICDHAIAELGLAGASISLVNRDTPEPCLESIAAVGQHSPFIRDMSAPLDKLTHASKTALGGEPIFVGNPHGMDEDATQTSGVARWRNGFGAHAYAVLALTVLEGTIGVMTLEWPEPHPFADSDREDLRHFADAVALVFRSASSPASQHIAAEPPMPTCEDADVTAFHANARGLVMPAALAESWGHAPAAQVWTAVMPAHPAEDSASFAEVVGTPTGGVLLAVGAISTESKSGASEVVVAGRSVLRAASAHGSSPGEVLGMLGSAMHSQSCGAWASGVVATYYPASGAVEFALAGAVALVTLRREGGLDVTLPDTPSVDTGRVPPCRVRVALPGDRIALLSGQVAALADPARVAAAKRALASLPDAGGEAVSRSLLSQVRDDDTTAAVCVLEVIQPATRDDE